MLRLLYRGPISYLSRDNFFVDPTERFKSYYWQSTLHTLLYNTILVCEPEDPRQESCSLVTDAEHKSCLPVKRQTILTRYVTNVRAIFVWHFNENARTKQKRQTNGNKAILLVYRKDTNAPDIWLVKRMLGWKIFMPENFLDTNQHFALTSYCNTIGQSNNAFSILGFSLAGKRRGLVLISFHSLADKTNTEHLPKPFFKGIRKSL